ncbi:MAG: hypothetical protein ABTQ73_10375 [Caldilineales bacterium]
MGLTRKLISLMVLAGLLLAVAACGGGAAEPAAPEPAAAATNTVVLEPTATPDALAGWITFTAPDGSFTVRMPQEPKVDEQTVTTEAGDIQVGMYGVEQNDSMMMVSHNGFPASIVELLAAGDPDVIKSMLDGGRDGAVGNVGGTFQSEHDVTVNGFPGREFTFTIDGANSPTGDPVLGTARVILTKDRLFQLIALETQDKANATLVQSFFDSFQLATAQ